MQVLMRYRVLGTVLLLAGTAAAWELTRGDSDNTATDEQLPYVMRELYPTSARILYIEAISHVMGGNLPAARQKFEEALATGDRTSEDLLYNYAITLVKMKANQQDIDDAITAWRYNFPFSDRDDPRKAVQGTDRPHTSKQP